MSKIKERKSKFRNVIYNHIINNKREYLIVTILFFIGIIIGVIFINNVGDIQIQEIENYLNNLFNSIKEYKNIDLFNLLKKVLLSNLIIIILLWIGSSTIIGIPIIYGTIIIKGFSIGYTISGIINSYGIGKGIIIAITLILLHNIIYIPTIFATCISGIRLYKYIIKNKNRENIKEEILRHTIFCIIMLTFMLLGTIVEIYISTNIFMLLCNNNFI